MGFEHLANHEHYYHTHKDFFNYPLDLVQAFLMEDYEVGMHEQEFYEINVITKGKGIHYINNNRVNASLGDVFIIPPHVSHGYVGGKGFDVFHVILSDNFMKKYLTDLQQIPSFYTLFGAEPLMRGKTLNPLHLTLSKEALDDTYNILTEITRYQSFSDPNECLIRSNFAMVGIGILCHNYTNNTPNTDLPFYEDVAMMKSISYIHERYFEKITIKDLTRISHISRSSYIKKFKEICRMSPSAYITKTRIESASAMLLNTTLSVSEIAVRTGFYDASHFIKTFESLYSMSPIEYRNQKSK